MTADARDKSFEYIDLLASTLTQHEKTLDNLIERLEKISENLMKVSQQARAKPEARVPQGRPPQVISYTKIDIPYNRPVEEITKMLETLTKKTEEEG